MPLLKKKSFRWYVFHKDKRQTRAKFDIQHFIKAPSYDKAINNNIRVYNDVIQEPDTVSASG